MSEVLETASILVTIDYGLNLIGALVLLFAA